MKKLCLLFLLLLTFSFIEVKADETYSGGFLIEEIGNDSYRLRSIANSDIFFTITVGSVCMVTDYEGLTFSADSRLMMTNSAGITIDPIEINEETELNTIVILD